MKKQRFLGGVLFLVVWVPRVLMSEPRARGVPAGHESGRGSVKRQAEPPSWAARTRLGHILLCNLLFY